MASHAQRERLRQSLFLEELSALSKRWLFAALFSDMLQELLPSLIAG